MLKYKSKLMSLLLAFLLIFTFFFPSADIIKAVNTLNVAEYISTSGNVVGVPKSNHGVYEGVWKASIPMGKVMSSIETEMKSAADRGYYPHGKDGANKIAYVEYRVEFPKEVQINDSEISMKNNTSMFNQRAFNYKINNKTVILKFPLVDENWAGVYNKYVADGGANSDKTIEIIIPYSVSANSLEEAKGLEQKNITAKGEFETHASGTFYSWTKTVYSTDVSTKTLATNFSGSNIFAQTEENNYTHVENLSVDLKIDENTGNTTIIKQKNDEINFVEVLDTKAIKDQILLVEREHNSSNLENIKLENVSMKFSAQLLLPAELNFIRHEAIIAGANNIFEIERITVDGQIAKVEFALVSPDTINNFGQLKDIINQIDDEIMITFKTVKFGENATSGTDYEVKSVVNGHFISKSTNISNGDIINFDLEWNGKQSDSGKSESNPQNISLSVKFLDAKTENVSKTGTLYGDLLVNGNTQHDKVYEAKKNDILTMTGLIDVLPIKNQLKELEEKYYVSETPENIAIDDLDTSFMATMILPEGLVFAPNYNVNLIGANNQFKIVEQKIENNTITIKMTLSKEAKTFKEIKDAVDGVDNQLKVNVSDIKFSNNSHINTDYTIKGNVSGKFKAKATNTISGNVINFDYTWYGIQLDGGQDSSDLNSSEIKLTLRYRDEKPIEKTFEQVVKLFGDILIGNETEHNKIYETTKNAKIAFTGILDVTPVKDQLKSIEEKFGKVNTDPNLIQISDYSSLFVAKLTLPEAMDFDGKPNVSFLENNDKYKIVNVDINDKTITIEMTVKHEVSTFADLKDAVNGMGDKLKMVVDGVVFNDKSVINTNYTVRGNMNGYLKAKAIETESGNIVNFQLQWEVEQLPEGADALYPQTKDITFTLKYISKNVTPTPVIPGNVPPIPIIPEQIKPIIPQKTLPNTGIESYNGVISLSSILVGLGIALIFRRKI